MLHTSEQSCTKCHHLRSIDAICNIFLLKEVQKCQHELNICLPTIFLPSIDVGSTYLIQRGRAKYGKSFKYFSLRENPSYQNYTTL